MWHIACEGNKLIIAQTLSLCWNNSPSDAYRSFEYSFVGFSWRLFEHVVFGLRSFITRVCLAMMVCTKWCPLVACGNACMMRLPSFFNCNAKLLTICVGLWFDVFDVSHSQPLTRSEPFQVIVACLCRHVRIAHRHTWTVCLEPTFPGPEFGAADGNRKMRNGFGIESLLKFDSSNFIDVWQRFWALQASTQKWCSLSLVASRSTRWPAALPSRNGCDQHWLSEFVRMGLLLTADIRMRAAIEKSGANKTIQVTGFYSWAAAWSAYHARAQDFARLSLQRCKVRTSLARLRLNLRAVTAVNQLPIVTCRSKSLCNWFQLPCIFWTPFFVGLVGGSVWGGVRLFIYDDGLHLKWRLFNFC